MLDVHKILCEKPLRYFGCPFPTFLGPVFSTKMYVQFMAKLSNYGTIIIHLSFFKLCHKEVLALAKQNEPIRSSVPISLSIVPDLGLRNMDL